MTKSILIKGEFTEEDFVELLQVIRVIERRHPEDNYYVAGDLSTEKWESVVDLMRRTFPVAPGAEPSEIVIVPFKKE